MRVSSSDNFSCNSLMSARSILLTPSLIPYNDSEAAPQLRDVTGNDNPMLGQKTANLVDEPDPVGDQAPANAVDSLYRQLIA